MFKTTWHNIRRSPYQAFAAISIMTLTFLVISFFTFIIFGSSKIINYFESVPQVTAFFKNDAKQSDIDALKSQLLATGKVAKLDFISKKDALKIYREQNKNDQLLLELVNEDILPPAFRISTQQIGDLPAVYTILKSSSIIDNVIFQKDVVSRLTSWTNALRRIGISLALVMSIFSMYIMVIIIGIKISQKREDIDIMRLLGATNWYIRWPFITEGIFYGLIGAFIGWFISSITLWYATPALASFMQGIPILPVPPMFFLEILGVELMLAIVLGACSSFLAVLRYLK